MLFDKSEIASISFVSMYNQIIPSIETSGNEASIAPINEFLLEISDTATIITEDNNTFVM